jgi:uncharacterized protein (DUF433 family)
MSNNSLEIPEILLKEVEKSALKQGISVEQFILWTLAEKVGVLSQSNTNSESPFISYKRGASGKLTPMINNTGIRVQTLVIAHYNWNLSSAEIAQEYNLTEALVKEALAFYQIHREEIDQMIASEQGLELANV